MAESNNFGLSAVRGVTLQPQGGIGMLGQFYIILFNFFHNYIEPIYISVGITCNCIYYI